MNGRGFAASLSVIVLMTLALHLNGLRIKHVEGDEVVFTFLALQLAEDPTAYHVRGELTGEAARTFYQATLTPRSFRALTDPTRAELLHHPHPLDGSRRQRYEPAIYDTPLFFHPPLYPYALSIWQTIFGLSTAVLLSAVCHGATVVMVGVLGRIWHSSALGLMAAGVMAVEAVSVICASRLWIDGMLQMTATGAVLAAVWAMRSGGLWRFALAGLILALAGLTKLPAGAVVPGIVAIWWLSPHRPQRSEMMAYALACGIPVGAWLLINLMAVGTLLPHHAPTPRMLDHSHFLQRMANRPATYYIFGVLFASPILLFTILATTSFKSQRWLIAPLAWAMSVFIIMMIMGKIGSGFQLRYLAPAMPALALLAAFGILRLPLAGRIIALPLGALSLTTGVNSAMTIGAVDPLAPNMIIQYFSDISSIRVWSWFEWIWYPAVEMDLPDLDPSAGEVPLRMKVIPIDIFPLRQRGCFVAAIDCRRAIRAKCPNPVRHEMTAANAAVVRAMVIGRRQSPVAATVADHSGHAKQNESTRGRDDLPGTERCARAREARSAADDDKD